LSAIWNQAGGAAVIERIQGSGYRLVESQESIATTEIVSTLERQALLEEMLDHESKPAYRAGTEGLHYLLSTPFRYPPLMHGSRFSDRFSPSLFYGGKTEHVALAEGAYYRLFFYFDMEDPLELIITQHTLFEFRYKTDQGVRLQGEAFSDFFIQIVNPSSYEATQSLGEAMRNDRVIGFEYVSARDRQHGINVALFQADGLVGKRPISQDLCLCEVNREQVTFNIRNKVFRFSSKEFMVDGELPLLPFG